MINKNNITPKLLSRNNQKTYGKLIEFILKAKRATYANSEGDSKKILPDGSKEFFFKDGKYSYRDRYFGSDSFVGEEVIFLNNKAAWAMNYYGHILDKTTNEKEIYVFLKKALMQVSKEHPYRGPSEFILCDYKYVMEYSGNLNLFSGSEEIYLNGRKIYELYFHGGKVMEN